MHQRRLQPSAPVSGPLKKDVLAESASSGLAFSAARELNKLVVQAKHYFDLGMDPDEVFSEFDIGPLKEYLSLDRRIAGEVLSLYKDRQGDEKFSASVLVATAVFFISVSEPGTARNMVADLVRRSRRDPSFAYIAKVTLISIAELSRNISEEAGFADEEFTALGRRCMDLFHKL